jgi:protein arginine N-methyltransferase 1
MYSLPFFNYLIADRVRTDAYALALQKTIRPGCVCLDIGTGTGFFAVLACRLGARKVIAVEPDDSLQVAREVAAANGCAERITFIQDFSTRIQLEERADVIVSELHGVLPLFQHHLPTLMDARRRLLAPGGVLIPRKETVSATVVEAPETYAHAVPLGDESVYGDNMTVHGVSMEAARSRIVNSWCKTRLKPEHFLTTPRLWASLDYTNLEGANVRGEVTWTVERPGTAHGLLLWFDTTLLEGVGFSNAPGQPEVVFGQGFFPWVRPVRVEAGDVVEVALRADLVGADYVWGWDSRVRAGGSAGQIKAEFRQSTFFGTKIAAAQLRKRAAAHRAALTEDGQIDRYILDHMDAVASVGDLARKVAEQFPRSFATVQDALTRVGDLAERYSL